MDVDAFILIGGRSSRFGTPKAFAQFEGQTLAARAAETVENALSPRSIRFIVGSDSQFVPDLIFRLGRPVVADLKPGFGAWSGLHAALAYASSKWTFVLACDLPFVSTALIRKLAELISDDVDAVVPRQIDDRLQSLCTFYRTRMALNKVEKQLSKSQSLPGVSVLFSALKTRIVEESEYRDLTGNNKFFVNVNSVNDLPNNLDSTEHL